jgi:pimeloyl-ACP methyl ester carboxylesterase
MSAASPTSFRVEIDQASLDSLRSRLAQTRWPDAETCTGWDQGLPLDYARELADYWQNHYDWRRCEAELNRWPQFTAPLQGLDIHFLHVVSPEPDALPLVLTHGWPGSILEFRKVIDALADPRAHGGDPADAFHVVVPSLPGYGFSGKPRASGTGVESIGRMWGELMARLGYTRYVAQGGDWGSMVTQSMAQTEGEHCAGIHITMPIVSPAADTLEDLSPAEQSALQAMEYYQHWGSGYSKQQATRPQTLGYGLADSPVGQMAWVVEKYREWTDCERDGVRHPEHILSRDELLDTVMLYWLTNSGASSARLYWESFHKPDLSPIDMPTGCSIFPGEIFRSSKRWVQQRFSQLIHWNELDRGGHFAALEQPELFLGEVRDCFRRLR